MGSAMLPLDRALLSSYRLSIVTIPLSVMVWPQFAIQFFTGVLTPKSPIPVGAGPCLIQCYLGIHEWPCQMASHFEKNGFSRVHECDRWTDRPCYSNSCHNKQNCFHYCRQIIIIIIIIWQLNTKWLKLVTVLIEMRYLQVCND